jgi:hypothetical protein
VSNNRGMWKVLEDLLGHRFATPPIDLIFAGALGAAVFAGRYEQTGAGNIANHGNVASAANRSEWRPYSEADIKVPDDNVPAQVA